jgi:hypothetical protein
MISGRGDARKLQICSPYLAYEMTNSNLFQKIQKFPKNPKKIQKFPEKSKFAQKTNFG